ncbi:hypothetical protein L2520_03715 [Limosilactobacillus vaginalis]|uniref:Uncharacterized protein n=1 Tax=Limosilactobacillus vaginalis TaxID=1633 RepID=A0ABT4K6N8_9LACO|nr:hypothetical protein [Limosilactobacillus vaginalis]MCZ3746530.1 hypothetical protein [Limosilactobacillus vaginalis]MCZ3751578.1 hypothetical protein [Limosilactobacillus vaginalis]MCZ3753264.1 hypothetical protein [Limosilactobacillus vaginalis]MCZ3755050.1 hypothetical protein [Limosilactobacillus vaginalis]MCZ3756750.1 hypothetical protein [Limosilactobacillus vaginalis]
MKLLKGAFYTTCGCLMTLFYREGMEVAMNWTFIIWLVVFAYGLSYTITPYKKATGAGTTDDSQK